MFSHKFFIFELISVKLNNKTQICNMSTLSEDFLLNELKWWLSTPFGDFNKMSATMALEKYKISTVVYTFNIHIPFAEKC